MSGGLLNPDLVRAFQAYFRTKGDSPRAVSEILPVVVLDDNSRGPYPPYRAWYASGFSVKTAAEYSYAWVTNEDGVPGQIAPTGIGKSSLVVDDIYCKPLDAADDYVVCISRKGSITADSSDRVNDRAEEKALETSTNPVFGNVTVNVKHQPGQLFRSSSQLWPAEFVVGKVTRIKGPFTVGPQGLVAVCPSLLNNGILAMFVGRYYGAA